MKKRLSFNTQLFSLFEGLIVISILGAIGVLIFPALDNTMEAAKSNHCISNLRTIAFSMNTYLGDYHLYAPFRQTKSTSTNPRIRQAVFWDDTLGKGYDGRNLSDAMADKWWLNHSLGETAGAEMYNCPEDNIGNLRDKDTGRPGFEKMQQNALGRTYSMNAFRSGNGMPNNRKEAFAGIAYRTRNSGQRGTEIWMQNAARVINPSQVFLMVEHPGAGWVGGGGGAATGNIPSQNGFYNIRWWQNRHGISVEFNHTQFHYGGYNYLFADGHAQNMLQEDTKGPNGTDFTPRGFWSISTND